MNIKHIILSANLKSWSERSTFHGLPQIASTERLSIKLIWTIFILASAGYCGKVVIKSVADYWNYDVNTVIDILRDTDADFPTVSFCTLHVCGLDMYDVNELLASYLNRTSNESNVAEAAWSSTNLRAMFNNLGDEYIRTSNRDDFLRVLSRNKTTIRYNLISCQYSSEFCYENDFEFFDLNEFQKCYKFNSGTNFNGEPIPIRKARRYGKSYGLQLELFIGLPENCITPFSQTFGIMVYVHNITTRIVEETSGILVAPGSETNIAVDRTFVVRKPKPYSDCIENLVASSAPNKLVADTFKKSKFNVYSQQVCLQLCQQEFIIETFGCYDNKLPLVKDSGTANVKPCVSKIDNPDDKTYDKERFYQIKADDKCLESCPNACEYVDYAMTVSSSQFPTITYSDVLVYNENISAHFTSDKSKKQFVAVKSSTLSLNVFYRSDLYTNVREKAATEFEQFVSNFGGALGLFLGISLLSLVEIFELFYEIVVTYFEKKRIKQKTSIRLNRHERLQKA